MNDAEKLGKGPQLNEDSSRISVIDILRGFKILTDEQTRDPILDTSTGGSFLSLVESAGNVSSVVSQLFPNAIPLDDSFFERLGEIRRWIGIGNSADEAIGIVWSEGPHVSPTTLTLTTTGTETTGRPPCHY